MRLRWARASLRSSEETSERGRLRGGPSHSGEGDGAEYDGDGSENVEDDEDIMDGFTVDDIVTVGQKERKGQVVIQSCMRGEEL